MSRDKYIPPRYLPLITQAFGMCGKQNTPIIFFSALFCQEKTRNYCFLCELAWSWFFLDEKHILFVLLLNVYLGLSPQAKTRRCIFVVLAYSLFKRMTWSWFTHHRSASGYGWCNKCQLWLRQRHKLRNQWYWLIYKGSVKPGQKKAL